MKNHPIQPIIPLPRNWPILAFLLFFLPSCSYLGLDDSDWRTVRCPEYLILKNAAETGSGSDWSARIRRLGAECRSNGEKMEMTLAIKTELQRIRADIDVPPISYFVAILNADNQVVSKQLLDVTRDFSQDPVFTVDIGNAELTFGETNPAYNIFVGFEHPSDQPKE